MKTLGIRLKELRIERGLLQADMASLLSVSLRQYQRYEKDESDMALSAAIMLAEYFNVSLDYLTGRSDRRNC
ncbi:helix-turn-helix domain-containing protein [Heyndrickxia sporothermodurans]|uniref:helix-turn-helix domain-containing protein n=1 Tax=Heyndrickxia sporothermodurans TaxID=46224 RepID=UPI000D388E51|nr:helix-turn-helix transcriptional regulator [Heyndrickxia sporothermodurans]PTY92333.1 transcriptional regulator [Heyndrickxia sporothermodurans]